MDEEKDDIVIPQEKPPMVNGQAVPLREGPMRSARPGKRLQPMDTSDEYDMNGNVENGDNIMQVGVIISLILKISKARIVVSQVCCV